MSNETKKIEDLKEFKDILLNKQRLMGLDLGSKRIGISVSDPELKVAISIKTIERNKLHTLTAELNEIINKFEIGGLIFGMPLNMDGTEGKSAQSAKDTADLLSNNLNISPLNISLLLSRSILYSLLNNRLLGSISLLLISSP